jgi:hypothetical protein
MLETPEIGQVPLFSRRDGKPTPFWDFAQVLRTLKSYRPLSRLERASDAPIDGNPFGSIEDKIKNFCFILPGTGEQVRQNFIFRHHTGL